MSSYVRFFYKVLIIVMLSACSTKKDNVFSRSSHSLATEFNILFNGNIALDEAHKTQLENYKENYYAILPVEPLKLNEKIIVFSDSINDKLFEEAEFKAIKAIQKHSIRINKRERNPQIDEAYMLLGKTRHYDSRFLPAIEAFNYIIYNYPNSNVLVDAKLWRERANIRLSNYKLAHMNIKKLFKQEVLFSESKSEALAILTQVYINLKKYDSASYTIKKSADLTKNKKLKSRYYFIYSQLKEKLNEKDSANMAYDKIISLKRKSDRAFYVYALLNKINNAKIQNKITEEIHFEELRKLKKNIENAKYLDAIYRQMALLFLKRDSVNLAIKKFKSSIEVSSNNIIEAENYKNLAEIEFEKENFIKSGEYYDQAILNIRQNSYEKWQIIKKRKKLNEIIFIGNNIKVNDSLLKLADMSKDSRRRYFEKYIKDLKLVDEEKTRDGEIAKLQLIDDTKHHLFYFYNERAVNDGKEIFKEKWGETPSVDDWNIAIENLEFLEKDKLESQTDFGENEERYNLKYYLSSIPKDKKYIDSIRKINNIYYYQSALIYKERFKAYDKAVEKLKVLVSRRPNKKLLILAKYNLFKIYEKSNSAIAESLKSDILNNYPNSVYAKYLSHPNLVKTRFKVDYEEIYSELYNLYKKGYYLEALKLIEEIKTKYREESIIPKVQMIEAYIISKVYGLEEYKKKLEEIVLKYPNKLEGVQAKSIVDNIIKSYEEFNSFEEVDSTNWKLVFVLEKEKNRASFIISKLNEILKSFNYFYLDVSKDFYNIEKTFVVVHGFSDKDRALGFQELLQINKNYDLIDKNFVISSPNYKIVQIRKNLSKYLNTFF